MLGLFLALVVGTPVQPRVVSDDRCVAATFRFTPEDGAVVTLEVNAQSAGVTASRALEHGDFSIVCDDFTAEQKGDVFRIRGNAWSDVLERLGDAPLIHVTRWDYPETRTGRQTWAVFARFGKVISFAIEATIAYYTPTITSSAPGSAPILTGGLLSPFLFRPEAMMDIDIRDDGAQPGTKTVQISRIAINGRIHELTFLAAPAGQ